MSALVSLLSYHIIAREESERIWFEVIEAEIISESHLQAYSSIPSSGSKASGGLFLPKHAAPI